MVVVTGADGVFSSGMSCVSQAQARMQESSQKVDLLRLSLERCLAELPQDHPSRSALQEGLSAAASPSYGTPKKQCSAALSSCTTSFFRPASLTGLLCCAVAPPGVRAD